MPHKPLWARLRLSAAFILSALLASPALTATVPTNAVAVRGVNIAGGEFGNQLPGQVGTHYVYPTKAEIDYYVKLGFTLIRVPFRWERLQPTLNGPLATTDRQALRDIVTYATAKGMIVVLDMHNYGQRGTGANYATMTNIGTATVPTAALSDAWVKIMADYKSNRYVWLGLMNEPHAHTAAVWWPIIQQVVKDVRAQKITNRVLVPGTSWTGAHSWVSSGNAAQAATFKDPSNNFLFEVHQYLDADSSGTSASCAVGSGKRVDQVIAWAKARKVMLFMGEMGGSSDPQCAIEYQDMLTRMETGGAFRAWAAWSGGTWWPGNYPFRTLPLAWPNVTTPTAHMTYLTPWLD